MSIHPRRALAEAEAAAWLDLHSDWAAGLGDPERRSVSGDRCRVVTSQALRLADADAAESLDSSDFRDRDAGEWAGGVSRAAGSASALGLTDWAPGWETCWTGWGFWPESEPIVTRPARADGVPGCRYSWDHTGRLPVAAHRGLAPLTADFTDDHGDWFPGPWSHQQLASRQAWAAALTDQPLRRSTDYRTVELQPEPTPDWARRLLRRERTQLTETTWVFGDLSPVERLARQQAAAEHRSAELVGRRLSAEATLTGDPTWPSFWAAQSFGRPAPADAEPDHSAAAVEPDEAAADWAAELAAAELEAWCRERLTQRQYECLVSDDLSDPAVRRARSRALDTLRQELPLHLRGLRRVAA